MQNKASTTGEDVRRSALYLVQMLITAILPIAILPIITRSLTPAEYGKFTLSLAFSTIIIGIISLGLVETIERNYYDHRGMKNHMASLVIGNMIVMTILFLVSVLLIGGTKALIETSFVAYNLDIILIIVVFSGTYLVSINTQLMLVARNDGRAARIAIISITASVINALVVLVSLMYFNDGVYALGYGIIVSNIFAVSIYFTMFIKDYGWAVDLNITLQAIRKGIWLLPRTFAGSLNTQLDKLVLNIVGTTSAVGIYALGQRLANGLFLVMNALQHVFTPRLYSYMLEDEKQVNGNKAGEYLAYYFFIISGIAIFSISISSYLIGVVAPASYNDSEIVFILLIWMYLNFFFGKVAGPQILLKYKTKLITFQAYIYLLLNAIFMVPLAKYFGIYGAAAGALISGTINTSISVWIGQKQYRIKWPIFKISIIYITFLSVVLIKLLMIAIGVNNIIQLTYITASLAGFIIVGSIIGIISRENIKRIVNESRNISV